MFNFMVKHKKGFTLVELLIVVALLGFGAVALANLFQSAIRTFTKTEERYIKQEMVKSVAEYLQSAVSINSATTAEVYDDIRVVPTVAGGDLSYSYIFVEKKDLDRDGALDGYYLYLLEKGRAKTENMVPLNLDAPIYISIDVYEEKEFNDIKNMYDYTNQCGVKIRICAIDNDYQYKDDETLTELAAKEKKGKSAAQYEADEIENYVFYDTVVSYHFPNMIDKMDSVRVNLMRVSTTEKQKYPGTDTPIPDKTRVDETGTTCTEDYGYYRSMANVYDAKGNVTSAILSTDIDGKILRVTTDTTLTSDTVGQNVSVSSFCFIATAGFGEATGEVGILCDFRDQCLKTNPLGRMFVKAYYTVSPPIADFIAEHETLKAATRVALKPLVAVAVYALEPELLIDQIPFIIMGIGSLGGIVAVGVARRRKLKIEN